MKIALLGFGNMGIQIDAFVRTQRKHEIVSVSYKTVKDTLDLPGIAKADVVIDFTSPAIVMENIQKIAKMKKNMVIGTSGWYEHIKEVEGLVKQQGIGLIFAYNFSIGVNMFFQLAEKAASLADGFLEYDAYGFEVHHSGKKDSPSGTAKKLAQVIIANMKRKKTAQFEKLDRAVKPEELQFASARGGSNFGMHEVVLDSPSDEIKLSIQARNRESYAKGALMAAEFIKGKKGMFSFEELFAKGKI